MNLSVCRDRLLICKLFSARCNIYISRLCYNVSVRLSVRLSVTEVHWRIIANLGLKFRSKFTAHCGRSPQCARMHCESQCMRALNACGRIVVAVHAGNTAKLKQSYDPQQTWPPPMLRLLRGGVISCYASHCGALFFL